ncbi:MAG: hypothetical protein HONBIEJF_02841 [Fimbriimonadaceae bacterium]|nr:hypothetical protein [Fimbriimonadaceae bacterium]
MLSSVTEPKPWRNGQPYSPNFAAAYSGYRLAAIDSNEASRVILLNEVAAEFKMLLDKGQNSRETFFFLTKIYSMNRDVQAQEQLDSRFKRVADALTWKVDSDLLLPEESALIASVAPSTANTEIGKSTRIDDGAKLVPVEKTKQDQVKNPTDPPPPPPKRETERPPTDPSSPTTSIAGKVPPVATKYALLIGNSESRAGDGNLPFAATNVMAIRESLTMNAGYVEENIDLVTNAGAEQILRSAKALADRIPDGATVLLYFAGQGANLLGKDFLAGIDTESLTDSSTMIAKADLYQLFVSKGAKVFAFFEVPRTINQGRYFGMEIPMVGMISQSQATLPGDPVLSFVKGGRTIGLYADAMCGVFNEMRSNRIPITEFVWQVYNRMRRGDTGTSGGGSQQTPTLPVVTNLASDARF